MDKEYKIFKLRLEQEYIYWQFDKQKHTYKDLDRLEQIHISLRKLTK